ncbi:MAG TPA: hypothetical protein PKH39_13385 [Woeseiaceae bacterium]|nr:hypothetical protein [Woeseiaceae bacterium]
MASGVGSEPTCEFGDIAQLQIRDHLKNRVLAALEGNDEIQSQVGASEGQDQSIDSQIIDALGMKGESIVVVDRVERARNARNPILYFELSRARDLQFVLDSAALVEQAHHGNHQVFANLSSDARVVASIVHEMRDKIPNVERELLDFENSRRCDLSESLKRRAADHYRQMRERPNIQSAIERFEYFDAKYGWPVYTGRLPRHELDDFHETVVIIEGMFKDILYSSNLYRLAILNELSAALTTSFRKDVSDIPGGFEHLGFTWKMWVAEGKFRPEEYELVESLNLLDREIPTAQY